MRRQLLFFVLAGLTLTFVLAACGGGGAASLDATEWVLTSLDGSSPLGNFSLSFADGQVSGQAGCNSYFGGFEQAGSSLSIPMIGMTEMFCMEPEGIMDQESLYLGILSRGSTFSVTGSQLRIESSDGAFLLFEVIE